MPHSPQETTSELPELMTVKETAEHLRVPLPTIYYLLHRWQLPGVQIGGRWRIKRSLLDRQTNIVTLAADPSLHLAIDHSTFNKEGDGIFTRPGHERDGNTDIFITGSPETNFLALGLREDFSGQVIHILDLDGNIPASWISGHTNTNFTDLTKTVQAVARLVKQNGHKGGQNWH